MNRGTTLYAGDYIQQELTNWRYTRLIMQSDGNLVEYLLDTDGSTVLKVCWATHTHTTNPATPRAAYQTDGNFVVYWGSTVKWASNTVGSTAETGSVVNMNQYGQLWAGFKLISSDYCRAV